MARSRTFIYRLPKWNPIFGNPLALTPCHCTSHRRSQSDNPRQQARRVHPSNTLQREWTEVPWKRSQPGKTCCGVVHGSWGGRTSATRHRRHIHQTTSSPRIKIWERLHCLFDSYCRANYLCLRCLGGDPGMSGRGLNARCCHDRRLSIKAPINRSMNTSDITDRRQLLSNQSAHTLSPRVTIRR